MGRRTTSPEQIAKMKAIGDQRGFLETRAAICLESGQYANAEAASRQSLRWGIGSGKGQEILASALDAQGKTQEALEAYKMIADRGAEFPRTLLPYAQLLLKTGQWSLAVDAYNKQLPTLGFGDIVRKNSHFSPDVPQPRELATVIHIALGLTLISSAGWGDHIRGDQAMNEFQQAIALEPNSPLANYYYGYGLKRLGRWAEAQAAFHKAAALDHGDIKAAALKELPGTMHPR